MKINFTQYAMTKLLALSKTSGSDEIGGIMIGYIDIPYIVVTDITVPKQKVTPSSISFNDDSINEQLSELFFKESAESFVGWWHTHGSMKTFWSQTDQKDGIDKFLKPLIDNVDGDIKDKWLASVVANADGDILGRIDYYVTSALGNYVETINEVPVVCLPIITDKHIAWATEQIKANVTKYVYTYQSYKKGKRGTHPNYYNWCEEWGEGCIYDDEDEVVYNLPEGQKTEDVKIVSITFTKEEEELIATAETLYKIDRQVIEDLVDCDYTVEEAIAMLKGDAK